MGSPRRELTIYGCNSKEGSFAVKGLADDRRKIYS
jgi:hypothetical protein